jgi:hypothetical protein
MLIYAHSLEVHTAFATLHLCGHLRGPDVDIARAMCSGLPTTIRVLRLDLRDVEGTDSSVRDGISSLVKEWRRSRSGPVYLAFADTMAPFGVPDDGPPVPGAGADAALRGTFL